MKEQLLSADMLSNGLIEDVYLVTPNNSGDSSVKLAVTHLSKPGRKPEMSVVLIHGQFSNRSVWFKYDKASYAEFLVEHGYDVWMPEMRGHGLSPENQRFQQNDLLDYINYDLPVLQNYLSTRVEGAIVWFGYGLSGVALSVAMARETMDNEQINGAVLLGLDDPNGAWRRHRLMNVRAWGARKRGYFRPTSKPSCCLEPEAYGVLYGQDNPLATTPRFGGDSQKKHFIGKVSNINVPVLVLAGAKEDTGGALDAYQVFQYWGGQEKKFLRYAHAKTEWDMLGSQQAQRYVWRDTAQWLSGLNQHQPNIDYVETA